MCVCVRNIEFISEHTLAYVCVRTVVAIMMIITVITIALYKSTYNHHHHISSSHRPQTTDHDYTDQSNISERVRVNVLGNSATYTHEKITHARTLLHSVSLMIHLQVHLQIPCYDFYFL